MNIFEQIYEGIVSNSKPRYMYHASKPKNRKSILTHGLNHRIHFKNVIQPFDTDYISYAPRGNYLDEDIKSLIAYFGKNIDIWKVNVQGLKLQPDQAWYKGWYCDEPITLERMTLVRRGYM